MTENPGLETVTTMRDEAISSLRAYRDELRRRYQQLGKELSRAERALRAAEGRPPGSRRLVPGGTDTLLGEFAALPHGPGGFTVQAAYEWMRDPARGWRSPAQHKYRAVGQAVSRRVARGELRIVNRSAPRTYERTGGEPGAGDG